MMALGSLLYNMDTLEEISLPARAALSTDKAMTGKAQEALTQRDLKYSQRQWLTQKSAYQE